METERTEVGVSSKLLGELKSRVSQMQNPNEVTMAEFVEKVVFPDTVAIKKPFSSLPHFQVHFFTMLSLRWLRNLRCVGSGHDLRSERGSCELRRVSRSGNDWRVDELCEREAAPQDLLLHWGVVSVSARRWQTQQQRSLQITLWTSIPVSCHSGNSSGP